MSNRLIFNSSIDGFSGQVFDVEGYAVNLQMSFIFDSDMLTKRQKRVLKLRFGFGPYRQHTLQQIGDIYSLSKERIRQIEGKALRILRNNKTLRALRY